MSDAHLEKGPDEPAAEVPKAAPPPANVPDGGFQAWLTVVGASAALFVLFGWVSCIGFFQAEYETNQLKGMHVCGLMMASLSHKYYQFMLSQSVVSGIGSSLIFTPVMSAVSFKRKQINLERQPSDHFVRASAPDLISPKTMDRWGLKCGRIVI